MGTVRPLYIHKIFLRREIVNSIVKNVYFTDHDTIRIILDDQNSDSEVDFQFLSEF